MEKEDIESLGWIYKSRTICRWYKWDKRIEDNYHTYGYWNKLYLFHCDEDKIKIIAFEYEDDEEHPLFQGRLKNKEELKTLMIQLGII